MLHRHPKICPRPLQKIFKATGNIFSEMSSLQVKAFKIESYDKEELEQRSWRSSCCISSEMKKLYRKRRRSTVCFAIALLWICCRIMKMRRSVLTAQICWRWHGIQSCRKTTGGALPISGLCILSGWRVTNVPGQRDGLAGQVLQTSHPPPHQSPRFPV